MDWKRWPWTTETRAGYTDVVTTALYEAAADPRAHAGSVAAGLERQLRDESKQQSGSLLTLPDPGTGEEDKQGQGLGPMNQFLGQLQQMKGRRLTFRGDWHEDKVPDVKEQRLGLSPPQAAVLLRQHLAQDLVAACGLPAALLAENATGEGLREVGRHALHWLLLPAGRLVEAAASELLDRQVTLDFDALMAGDLRSRGQFVKAYVDAGGELADALAKAGLAA